MNTYPSYQDSGVEWISEIPSGWNIKRMCYVFKTKSIKNTHNEINLSVYRDYGVIPTDSRNDNHNVISEDTSNYKLVEIGDFVMNKMKCWMGSLGLSDYRGIVSPSYIVMKPLIDNDHKYIHYLLRSKTYIPQYKRLSYGVRVGQWDLRFEDFRELPCLLPPLQEQQQITDYLDYKTSKIDKLIEKTEQKIELLKEQRTSLINITVTKGLNPNVEMKDSGVEWIGEIPSGWDVRKLKHISKVFGRIGFKGYTVSDIVDKNQGVVTLSPSNIKNDIFNLNSVTYLSFDKYYESPEIMIFPDDIIIVKTGSTIGKTTIIPDSTPKMTINPQLIVLKNITILPKFLYFQTICKFIKESFKVEQTGSSTPTITQEKINNFPVLELPIQEQKQIIDYLDKETSKIDKLINIETKRIVLLKEYHQSLISEVVTGKVDVRNEVLV